MRGFCVEVLVMAGEWKVGAWRPAGPWEWVGGRGPCVVGGAWLVLGVSEWQCAVNGAWGAREGGGGGK